MGNKKDSKTENSEKKDVFRDRIQQEYNKQSENRKNIGNERRISNPSGSSRSSDEFRKSQRKERNDEIEEVKKLGVVSERKKNKKK